MKVLCFCVKVLTCSLSTSRIPVSGLGVFLEGGLDDGGLDGEMKDEGKRVVVLTCCVCSCCCLFLLLFVNLFSIVSHSHLFLTPLRC